jgi:O-antigen/teichoic acid export membrane protein
MTQMDNMNRTLRRVFRLTILIVCGALLGMFMFAPAVNSIPGNAEQEQLFGAIVGVVGGLIVETVWRATTGR